MPKSAYELATSMLGSNENKNHAMLTQYLKNGGVNLDPAQQAWCAAFVNSSLSQAGLQGTGSNMARSFQKWGVGTNDPKPGDIAVFSRGGPNSGSGHVGFYEGRAANGNIPILGGNQSNSVSETVMPASRLLGFRTGTGLTQNPFESGTSPVGYVDPSTGAPSTVPAGPPTGISLASNPMQAAAMPPTPAPPANDWQTSLGKAMSGIDEAVKGIRPKGDPTANQITPANTGADLQMGQQQSLAHSLMSDILSKLQANASGTDPRRPNVTAGMNIPIAGGTLSGRTSYPGYGVNLMYQRPF